MNEVQEVGGSRRRLFGTVPKQPTFFFFFCLCPPNTENASHVCTVQNVNICLCCDVKHPVGLRSRHRYEKVVSEVIEGIDAI